MPWGPQILGSRIEDAVLKLAFSGMVCSFTIAPWVSFFQPYTQVKQSYVVSHGLKIKLINCRQHHFRLFVEGVMTTYTVNVHTWWSTGLNASCVLVFISFDETNWFIYTTMESDHSNAHSPVWLKTDLLSVTQTLLSFLLSWCQSPANKYPYQGNSHF